MEQNSRTKLTNTQENLVAGAAAVVTAALLLIFVGWPRIRYWFSTPIVWNDPDYITVKAVDMKERADTIDLQINVINASSQQITSYKLDIVCDSAVYSFGSVFGWGDGHILSEEITVRKEGYNAAFFKALSGKAVKDLALEIHVRSLYNKDEKIVKQSGLMKIILLAALSLASGLLAANIKNQWLRLLLKLLSIPSLALLIVLMAFVSSSGGSKEKGRSAADEGARRRAAENYKRQAGYKAGAKMTGRPQDAARAQGQMDRSFADMIAANDSQAKKEYQRWAQHKANAEMRGNQQDAAFAQRRMDRYMAEMLQGK